MTNAVASNYNYSVFERTCDQTAILRHPTMLIQPFADLYSFGNAGWSAQLNCYAYNGPQGEPSIDVGQYVLSVDPAGRTSATIQLWTASSIYSSKSAYLLVPGTTNSPFTLPGGTPRIPKNWSIHMRVATAANGASTGCQFLVYDNNGRLVAEKTIKQSQAVQYTLMTAEIVGFDNSAGVFFLGGVGAIELAVDPGESLSTAYKLPACVDQSEWTREYSNAVYGQYARAGGSNVLQQGFSIGNYMTNYE